MSKYTTEIRYLCESMNENKPGGYASVAENIEAAIPHIFSFDFPMFDEDYRNVLCTKILRHYYTREIGEETYGLWKLRLETKLNEIMPYYNKLYESGLKEFNPLFDMQLKTEYGGNKTGSESEEEGVKETETVTVGEKVSGTETEGKTGTKTSRITAGGSGAQSDSGTSREDKDTTDKYSDTPQGGLEGVVSMDYLTNARIVENAGVVTASNEMKNNWNQTSEETGSSKDDLEKETEETRDRDEDRKKGTDRSRSGDSKSTEEYVLKVSGRNGGDVAKRLMELKDTLLNIDMMIIRDLEVLFMNVW